jgi:hypothetical protein
LKKVAALLALLAFISCNRTAGRTQWQHMSQTDKTLYVKSLLGHEQALRAKGGNERAFPLPAEEYVRRIDAAYARGERRNVDELFESLAERRGGN